MLLTHFRKFTERLEVFTNNILTKYLSKVFLRPFVLKIIRWYNLLLLLIFNLGFSGLYFDFPFMSKMHNLIVVLFGVNAFGFIIQGFVTFKFKFCSWSKLAFVCDLICYGIFSVEFLNKGQDGNYSAFAVYSGLFLLLFVVIYTGITYRISDTDPTIKDSGNSSPM